jgi:excinuclease ABC subunit A
VDQIVDTIMQWPAGTRIQLLSPVIRSQKGEHKDILEGARKAGYARARIDGVLVQLDDPDSPIKLDKQKKHIIELVVDRLIVGKDIRNRLAESCEQAMGAADGTMLVLRQNVAAKKEDTPENERRTKNEERTETNSVEEIYFSQKNSCPDCGISIPELQPRLFSFNNPFGACPDCGGLGNKMEFDIDLIVPNKDLSFNEGGFLSYSADSQWYRSRFEALADSYGWTLDTPYNKIPKKAQKALLYGTVEDISFHYTNKWGTHEGRYNMPWPGIYEDMRRRYRETTSDGMREWFEQFMKESACETCGGRRLKPEVLGVTIGGNTHGSSLNDPPEKRGLNIFELTSLSVKDSIAFFNSVKFTPEQMKIASQILKEINSRLGFMRNVGLEYLTLERAAGTLSGGEAQRIRLATQIGSALTGVLYVLDEPSIGLHQRDNQKLIDTLTYLRDLGNTVIVVEHDEQTLRTADWLVDLGPGAGVHGGYVVAQGTPAQVAKVKNSLTGQYLAGTLRMDIPEKRRPGNGHSIKITGATEHNLKNIDVEFPLGCFTVVTGVSGSGKSSLLADILYPALANRANHARQQEGKYKSLTGVEFVDKVINIDQSPIGRTPRSNPATYVGVFNAIRDLFASLPESKARGYKPGRFSFNVRGGRCEACQGDGIKKIEMNFLSDVFVTCDVCGGKRFNRETLDITFKGKNIADVLDMTIEEACTFFENIPSIARKMDTLLSVGLGYVKLGQSALTLSGGEAQRVKLALELSKRGTGKTVYILDEPTTGLHFADVKQLMEVIHRLVDGDPERASERGGNTVIMIEHNMDVILQADYLIDLGPEGGDQGGNIVCTGTPEEVAKVKGSWTGQYIKQYFATHKR